MAAKSKKKAGNPLTALEESVKLVYDGKYEKARAALQKLIDDGQVEQQAIATARTYLRICQNQLSSKGEPEGDTAEALYDWAVVLHNSGEREQALKYFEKALKKAKDDKDHIYYGMAAAEAASKNADKAVEYLAKAAGARPERTFQATNDPDFREISSNQGFKDLIKEHSQLKESA
ncbi:MAG TPA: tetratricopeptide repeat protein [Acidobacteriota bacterium]|nr:tetratricopeptide repeat protein [Acidobacteriota bacterium]